MSSTFYIDTNRKNSSVKSRDNKNEWEYKLSNNIQLPAGTEIAIQDTFIHQQGISGATVVFEEDINETLYFSVYLSDNPHFVPKNTFEFDTRNASHITKNRAFQPTFTPFGLLANNPTFNYRNVAEDGTDSSTISGNEQEAQIIEQQVGETFTDPNLDTGMNISNAGYYYNEPLANQRIALWEDDGTGRPRLDGATYNNIQDPYLSGYSEYPMMAVYVKANSSYADNFGDSVEGGFNGSITKAGTAEIPFARIDSTTGNGFINGVADASARNKVHKNQHPFEIGVQDHRFFPYVKSVDIYIRKGVYSIAEVSDLIENQINGKYVNLKQDDDYYNDTITQKSNNQTYTGTLETNGVYTKVQPLDRHGGAGSRIPDTCIPATGGASQTDDPTTLSIKVNSMSKFNGNIRSSKVEVNSQYVDIFASGHLMLGTPFNDQYSLPYYNDHETQTIDWCNNDATGTTPNDTEDNVPKWMLTYNDYPNATQGRNGFTPDFTKEGGDNPIGCVKGRRPVLPAEDEIFYIPVHFYNQLVKLWKHEDIGGGAATQNSYLYETGNWTVNSKRMFRYAFQQKLNIFSDATQSNNGKDTAKLNKQTGNDEHRNGAFIGLHTKVKVNAKADIIQPVKKYNSQGSQVVGVSVSNYNYDIFSQGYYIGTPDFEFSYDSDNSAYKISGLHQSIRMPSCDAAGNPVSSEGESGLFLKRASGLMEKGYIQPQRSFDYQESPHYTAEQKATYKAQFDKVGGASGFEAKIKSVINNNESRVGGIAIYNWAYQTALKYGDIDPKTYRKPFDPTNPTSDTYKVYDNQYQSLWKFQDFFSSEEKAREAWEKSLWSRLGFTYDNLQNSNSWEKVPYYDLPVDKYSNEGDTVAEQQANTYFEERTQMYFKNEDFTLYGKTTNADIGVDSAPTVSTVFNNSLFTFQPNPASKDQPDKSGNLHQIIRTYDNSDISRPYFSNSASVSAVNYFDPIARGGVLTGNPAGTNGNTTTYSYENSVYWSKIRVPVLTESKSIIATKLPQLSEQGYYIITSNIVDGYTDEIKQGQPMAMLGIVPISNLSNQDFITTKNDIIHTLQQAKNLNSIRIKILNPDLTAPSLLDNSSVILRITTPLPPQTNQISDQQDGKHESDRKTANPNPHSNDTPSGRNNNKQSTSEAVKRSKSKDQTEKKN